MMIIIKSWKWNFYVVFFKSGSCKKSVLPNLGRARGSGSTLDIRLKINIKMSSNEAFQDI